MKVVIIGAGGLGKVMAEALQENRNYQVVGFLDDFAKGFFCDLPILGTTQNLKDLKKKKIEGICLGIGDRFLKERLELIKKIRLHSFFSVNVIHPTAWISSSVTLKHGIYIGPRVCVHSATVVEDFATVWTGCVIEHNNHIGENSYLGPAVVTAGYTEIGSNVFIGMGSIILRCKIGSLATVAAGSLVIRNVAAKTMVMGHPAKVRSKKNKVSYYP